MKLGGLQAKSLQLQHRAVSRGEPQISMNEAASPRSGEACKPKSYSYSAALCRVPIPQISMNEGASPRSGEACKTNPTVTASRCVACRLPG